MNVSTWMEFLWEEFLAKELAQHLFMKTTIYSPSKKDFFYELGTLIPNQNNWINSFHQIKSEMKTRRAMKNYDPSYFLTVFY